MMNHTRPRYFTLGDLQATPKLSYSWSGPTDQCYANNLDAMASNMSLQLS